MIIVTRLHGGTVAVNCDLIERVEAAPDTVVTLVDGSRYVVRETVAEIVDKVRAFRASVVNAGRLDPRPPASTCTWCRTPTLRPSTGTSACHPLGG
jgi:flagellar protein FlbD